MGLAVLVAFAVLLLGADAARPETGNRTRTKVVTLMLENRSFSHLLGFLRKELSGREFNRLNSSDPNSKPIYLKKNPPYVLDCDADHSMSATTAKLYGLAFEEKHGPGARGVPTMGGFVEWQYSVLRDNATDDYCSVMTAYQPDRVPVLSFLATEFAVFDKYHCSFPGPTWPNRAFALMGTSDGLTETSVWYKAQEGMLLPSKTFGEQLLELGHSYKMYYQDSPWELFIRGILHRPQDLAAWDQFHADSKNGALPDWSFIWPRMGIDTLTGAGSNDQHPDHDVALGEALMKEVYEALRNGPQWEDTLLLITYDEHGGFWDQRPPPQEGIPAPSPHMTSYPDMDFGFDRLGIRVPMVAISPRIPRGTVVSEPPAAQKPFPTSLYDHTSIMATTRKLLGINASHYLTERDRWAATFEHILSLEQPRKTPRFTPAAPKPTVHKEHLKPVNDLQKQALQMHARFGGTQSAERQGELMLGPSYKKILASLNAELAALRLYVAAEQPGGNKNKTRLTDAWDAYGGIIATLNASKTFGAHLCVTQHIDKSVGVAVCDGSAGQKMSLSSDFTIRNTAGECATVEEPEKIDPAFFGQRVIRFRVCDGSVKQHFGYLGKAPGNLYTGQITYGAYLLGIYRAQ